MVSYPLRCWQPRNTVGTFLLGTYSKRVMELPTYHPQVTVMAAAYGLRRPFAACLASCAAAGPS